MSHPFPYAPFLVMHYNLTHDPREAGFYTGMLLSAFMLGRMLSSFPLGLVSDTLGRRPVIEIGLVSCLVFQATFAFSPGIRAALLSRFLMGAFNGIIGVAKAWLPELFADSWQTVAMSLISGMWGIGNIAGPAIGGLLYSRATTGLLGSFPALMPSLVGMVLSVVALLATRLVLPRGSVARTWRAAAAASDRAALASHDSAKAVDEVAAPSGAGRCCSSLRGALPSSSYLPIAVYCFYSLVSIFYQEICPLWLVAPVGSGGLGWSASDVGVLQSTGGGFLALSNFVFFPILARRLAPSRLFWTSACISACCYALTPHLATVDASRRWPTLVALNAVVQAAGSTCFTSLFLIINSSCEKEQRGAVNGMAMALSSAFKAVGPMVGSALFAWSLTNGLASSLLDVHFTFYLISTAALCTALVGLSLERSKPVHSSTVEMRRRSASSARESDAVAERAGYDLRSSTTSRSVV